MPHPFELPKLPYSDDALSPIISPATLGFHYGKHHQAYVTNLNGLVPGTTYAEMPLEKVITESRGKDAKIFNNSAQIWNHTFYWNCLSPKKGQKPGAELMAKIEKAFGSFEEFKKKFATACVGQFASGWGWLVMNKNGELEITTTSNAETPLGTDKKALLTIDVWEHAYYVDYQNRRPDYVNALVDQLLNWEFATRCAENA